MTPSDNEPDTVAATVGRGKLLLFALIPVTLLVLVAEVAATLTIERSSAIVSESSLGGREYRMQVGVWPWSRRVATRLNTDGFPDEEFPSVHEPKTCIHLVFVGDSFVLGDGVDGDSSFTAIIGRAAAARPGFRCVRTFNLGERGSTIPRQARRVRELRARLRPDVVVLAQYQNDLTDLLSDEPRDLSLAAMERAAALIASGESRSAVPLEANRRLDQFRLMSPRLVRFLAYHAFAAFITNGIPRDELLHWSALADPSRRVEADSLMRRYAASFDSLASDLARDSIAFGTLVLPSKFDVMAARYPEEAFFTGLAARRGLPALRLFPLLHAQRTPYAFLMYDGHLNEHGNRIVAATVIHWLFERDPAPFPSLRVPEHGVHR